MDGIPGLIFGLVVMLIIAPFALREFGKRRKRMFGNRGDDKGARE